MIFLPAGGSPGPAFFFAIGVLETGVLGPAGGRSKNSGLEIVDKGPFSVAVEAESLRAQRLRPHAVQKSKPIFCPAGRGSKNTIAHVE